jgi:hypothetical protein
MFTTNTFVQPSPLCALPFPNIDIAFAPAVYARDGVQTRTAMSTPSPLRPRVGIIAQDWPRWLHALSPLHYELLWIVTDSAHLVSIINHCLPGCRVFSSAKTAWDQLATVQVLFCNGPWKELSFHPPQGVSLVCFDWLFRQPRWLKNWKFQFVDTVHASVGGVSDFRGSFRLGWPISAQNSPVSPKILHCYPITDVGSILDCKNKGFEVSQPRLPTLQQPEVKLITHGAHHHRGLFPLSIPDAYFITPCVFSATHWVKRKLTLEEMLLVHDFPVSLTTKLADRTLKIILPLLIVPLKCHQAVVDSLPRIFSGGGGDLGGDLTAQLPLALIPSGSNNALQPIIPQGWLTNVTHKRREGASMSDSADINLNLWNNHLEGLLKRTLNLKDQKALSIIQFWLVNKLWKRAVTKCFCSWLRCKKCHKNNFIDKLFDDGGTIDANVSCLKCAKVMAKEVELQGGRYVWKDRSAYQKWWNGYHQATSDLKEHGLNVEAGLDCLRRAGEATVWKWNKGSRPFFWRWGEFWKTARDGAKVCVETELPRCTTRQTKSKEEDVNLLMAKKLSDVRAKGYISPGHVKSVTSFFSVPKGPTEDKDIRMVYNGTSSGLNAAVWAPWFSLPTVEDHLRAVQPGTFMIDIDLTEMFLNFMLDRSIRAFAGVDLTKFFENELTTNSRLIWERWERMLMGFKPSPYLTTRELHRVHEFLCGNRHCSTNVFRWDKVIMNLPGSAGYTPDMPRVYRVRKDGTLAADLFKYMDDLRCTAPTAHDAWMGAKQICGRLSWLGLQDAPRKRSNASITPRAWAGSIIHTDNEVVTVLVSEVKWGKTKAWLKWMKEEVVSSNGLNRKELERCIGFLIYVSRTYRSMIPFLKGMHKTLDGWRGGRDNDGWKYYAHLRYEIEDDCTSSIGVNFEGEDNYQGEAPEYVKPVPRLEGDVNSLLLLTRHDAPPKVTRRRNKIGTVVYGVLDASGKGFGYALEIMGVTYTEYGVWSAEVEKQHSNYKELRNLVNAVENACLNGKLGGTEMYLFTDNFTAECAYYRGGSNSSKILNGLIFKLWNLQMMYDFALFVYHIAGTRMIASGIDGLSRGDKTEGIAKGDSILKHVPIHLAPTQRHSVLKHWLENEVWNESLLGKLHWMTYEDWFDNLLKKGNFVWDVPPSAGETAVEQLCSHTHGRPEGFHIFLTPRLCTSHWRKQLLKCCDFVLTLPFDNRFWPNSAHEPLLMGIHFPLLPPLFKFRPWKLKRTKLVADFEIKLRRLYATGDKMDWSVLREFLLLARSLPTLPERVARELLQTKTWG